MFYLFLFLIFKKGDESMSKKTIAKYVLKGIGAVLLSAAAIFLQDELATDVLNGIKKQKGE